MAFTCRERLRLINEFWKLFIDSRWWFWLWNMVKCVRRFPILNPFFFIHSNCIVWNWNDLWEENEEKEKNAALRVREWKKKLRVVECQKNFTKKKKKKKKITEHTTHQKRFWMRRRPMMTKWTNNRPNNKPNNINNSNYHHVCPCAITSNTIFHISFLDSVSKFLLYAIAVFFTLLRSIHSYT